MKSKYVIFIFIGFFLLPLITSGKYKNKRKVPTFENTFDICEEISEVPREMINQFFEDGEMYDDYSFKCFLACLFDVTGKISENKIIVSKVLDGLNQTHSDEDLLQYWRETVPICALMDELDVCEHVFTFLKCIKLHPEL